MASSSFLHPLSPAISSPHSIKNPRLFSSRLLPLPKTPLQRLRSSSLIARARERSNEANNPKESNKTVFEREDEVEVEADLPWIQEKSLDLVEFMGTVTRAIPGPRVGPSTLPWILAVPITYVGLSFFIAVVRTVKKFTSPKAQRRRLVNKNAVLLKSIDELFQKGKDQGSNLAPKGLMQKYKLHTSLRDRPTINKACLT